jgi:membrane protein YqaA with SNARE-associated domain
MTIDAKQNTAFVSFFKSERYRWVAFFLIWLAHLIYFFITLSIGIFGLDSDESVRGGAIGRSYPIRRFLD